MPYTLPVVKVRLKSDWMDYSGSSRLLSRFPCTNAPERARLGKLVFRTILDPVACKFSALGSSSGSLMSLFALPVADQPDAITRDIASTSIATYGSTVGIPARPPDPDSVACFGWPLDPTVEPDQINYDRSDFVRDEMARALWLDHPSPRPIRMKIHYFHTHCFEPISTRQPKYALVSESAINSTTIRFTYARHP
jgi:hypothetical protein